MKLADYPNYFYRFRSCRSEYFEEEVKRALGGEHYFSSIETMNDPFDCNPAHENSTDRELLQAYKALGRRFFIGDKFAKEKYPDTKIRKRMMREKFAVNYANIRKFRPLLDTIGDRIRQESKIICLSESWENPLMWAHYASSHDGVVFKFRFHKDNNSIWEDEPPIKIEYSKDRLKTSTVDILSWLNSETGSPEYKKRARRAFEAYVLHKPSEWSYEDEWRIQKRWEGENGYSLVPCLKLEEIIVGCRVKRSTIDRVAAICNGRCKLTQTYLDGETFALNCKSC